MKIKEFILFALGESGLNKTQFAKKLDYKYVTDADYILNAPNGAHFQNILEAIDALGYELVVRKKPSVEHLQNAPTEYVINYEMDEHRFKRIRKRIEEQQSKESERKRK